MKNFNFLKKYSSLVDFFFKASKEEKSKVFREVARLSNEDQLKIFKK